MFKKKFEPNDFLIGFLSSNFDGNRIPKQRTFILGSEKTSLGTSNLIAMKNCTKTFLVVFSIWNYDMIFCYLLYFNYNNNWRKLSTIFLVTSG